MSLSQELELFTHRFAKWCGSACGFLFALLSIFVWLLVGWFWKFPYIWVVVLSLYVGMITFLMVFLIQRCQNKESMILHVKLNELLSVTKHTNMRLMDIGDLRQKEISKVQDLHHKIQTEE